MSKLSEGFRYPLFIPYPISWIKAILLSLLLPVFLIPINEITGMNFLFLLLTLPTCFIWSLVVLTGIHHVLRLGWKDKKNKALGNSLIIWLSFLIVIIPLGLMGATECKLSLAISDVKCNVRGFRFATHIIFKNAKDLWDFNGNSRSLVPTIWQPWFTIWVVVAAYLSHIGYLTRDHVIPWLKNLWTPRKIKRDEIDIELEQLRTETQNHRTTPKSKSKVFSKRLLIIATLVVVLGTAGYFSARQKLVTVTPKVDVNSTPLPTISPSPSVNSFGEGIKNAMEAAQLTQTAKTEVEWQSVANYWQEAINQMQQVPSSDQNYAIAQNRIPTYQQNLAYALKRLEMIRSTK